jgi:nucleoside-diphosphate-sugar epimerase
MKIAVTGATGFIGKHVIDVLKKNKEDIITISRQSPADVIMDIANADKMTYHNLGYPDVLIHLAWDGLPNYHSLHHFETELPKQYNFLKQLIDAGLPKLIVTGSCFEYGKQSGGLSINHPIQPNNPYSYAKTALHQQLQFLQKTKSFQLTWTRLFYLYGEGQASSSLYYQLKQAIANGDKHFNMSLGEQLRDFLPVEQAAEKLVELALLNHQGIVNICSGKPISVRSLVEKWIGSNDIKLNLGFYPYPDYEPMAYWGIVNQINN